MIYFGYGSNLNPVALRAKGVDPLHSEPAVLRGWRLEFSVTPPFPSQGAMATIRPGVALGDAVHGTLHYCDDNDFSVIDLFEARGTFYDRIEVQVERYAGGEARACVYTVLPDFHDPNLRPTARYLNLLLGGAEAMRLDPAYVAALRRVETLPARDWPDFQPPAEMSCRFDAGTLARSGHLFALAGAVFDMSSPAWNTAFLIPLWGGKDVTLSLLRMLDPSLGAEMDKRIRRNDLDSAQRRHINGYLHECAAAFRYVGRYDYV